MKENQRSGRRSEATLKGGRNTIYVDAWDWPLRAVSNWLRTGRAKGTRPAADDFINGAATAGAGSSLSLGRNLYLSRFF